MRNQTNQQPTSQNGQSNDEKITGCFQGVNGAHSELALKKYLEGLNLPLESQGVETFRQVVHQVLSGQANLGIVPIDNAIAGTVREGYDLLAEYDLDPVAEIDWRMDHRLLANPGAELSDIREIYAHPLVLNECGKFTATLTGAKLIPWEDTGLAAKKVAESGASDQAAIAPAEAAELYGLHEIARNIADHPENITRFMVFRLPKAPGAAGSIGGRCSVDERKTSFLFGVSHEYGSLSHVLNAFSQKEINLTKLESRPKLGKPFEYIFYADFEGDLSQEHVAEAMKQVRNACHVFKVIGSYDRYNASSQEELVIPQVTEADLKRDESFDPSVLPASADKGWPKVSRKEKPQGSAIQVGPVTIQSDEFTVIAGPCSVESKDQVMQAAQTVKSHGAKLLRGGAFKPRTHPYSFQGLGWEGVSLLTEASRATGLPAVSEVMSVDQVERMAREIDVLQVGARNMQNFDLLKAVGQTEKPVLLKRGMSANLDELLAAAEYIVAEGNPNVMICERGIRTFETATRNTLDLGSVPVLKERTHLPVLIDPSHAIGVRRWIRPMCLAAKAAGADGIIIEVHPNPPEAKSDKDQALYFEDFARIMNDLKEVPKA